MVARLLHGDDAGLAQADAGTVARARSLIQSAQAAHSEDLRRAYMGFSASTGATSAPGAAAVAAAAAAAASKAPAW